MMWSGGYGGWGMGYAAMGLVHGLLWIVLIVVAIVALVRWLRRDGSPQDGRVDTPRSLLDKRYAKGEIDKAEYLEKRRDLES